MRSPTRTIAYMVGLALAVALFSGTLFFIDGQTRSMTQRALAPVRLDFQARALDPKTDIASLAPLLQKQAGVKTVLPFASAAITSTSTVSSQAQPSRLFALPPDYQNAFPLLPLTTGRFEPGSGVLVSEQLAVSLHLKLGDTFKLVVPGLNQPYPVKLAGTVNTDIADPLFSGPTSAPEGAYNFAAAVVVIDYATFTRDLAAPLQTAADQASQSNPNNNTSPSPAVFGLPLLDRQLHISIQRDSLPSDPGEAQLAIGSLRRNLERQASGQIKISDNLSSTLINATRDVVSARLLFIFLGLPGVLLAAYLSRYATQLVVEGQRREVALLRSRGIAPRRILAIMGWTAVLVALAGTVLGLGIGAISTATIFGSSVFNNAGGLLLSALYSLLLGLALGGIGVFLPARRMLEGEVNEERRVVAATKRPIWLRLPLDLALLSAAGLAFWFSSSYNNKTATAGASETAAVSLGIYSFLGPLLFWLGAALLFWRIIDWLLTRPQAKWRGGINGLAGRSLRQRNQQSAGAALLLALALSFGVATTTFGATYDSSRRAEARYIIGSDLRITPALTSPQPASFADQIAKVNGVQAVAPVATSSNVLVGSQTQTVYAVDVPSLTAATYIPDSFFVGDSSVSAKAILNQLAATPNGLLVSNELANSYNIQSGDQVNMRIPIVTGGYFEAKLQVVGIFNMFPTSSQNSDLVVNRSYLTDATKNPNISFVLAKTDGTASTNEAIASTLNSQFKNGQLAARIETANRVVSQDQSSLAGLNLSGLLSIDRFYAALIIALGLGVFLLGSILERQRELGTLQALGATRSQVTRLLLTEGLALVAGGVIGGLVIGLLLAWQYNTFLTGIFAVSLPVINVPIPELALLMAMGLLGIGVAALLMAMRVRRLWPAEILRDA